MIEMFRIAFGPSANQLRIRQLETAKRELLVAQSQLEVIAAKVAMYQARIARLQEGSPARLPLPGEDGPVNLGNLGNVTMTRVGRHLRSQGPGARPGE